MVMVTPERSVSRDMRYKWDTLMIWSSSRGAKGNSIPASCASSFNLDQDRMAYWLS